MITTEEILGLFPSFDRPLAETIAQHASLQRFREGTTLIRTGQQIRSILLITAGLVKLSREEEDGGEFFMYYLQPGQACALSLMCTAKDQRSEVTAVATEDTEALAIPVALMDTLMREHRRWYVYVLETYRSRFGELLNTIDQIAFRNMDQRLLFYLKKQQEVSGTARLSLSNTAIAKELNSSREVISRLMKQLAEKGYITQHKGYTEILKLPG
ncbi:Crp/Fnr family transcriptional regulator [Sediminibacterium ginsengisoli]|uniref:CRP/FNR family transcriptional regulator, anaerobic regulatory protein n=1 Tax=Sediminibacterium ginsengisoli TaxID=413434 RepID=A0A1T4LDC4_9BACT|nr:Crp/Fnr family transcriptional regulator [Sediminibacterium ginsengisoli]SJZ52715.1 CRP/FNR family transcriptional regulator, anaerobic regulatory protein [Sediminibacterium ginsengisoli]